MNPHPRRLRVCCTSNCATGVCERRDATRNRSRVIQPMSYLRSHVFAAKRVFGPPLRFPPSTTLSTCRQVVAFSNATCTIALTLLVGQTRFCHSPIRCPRSLYSRTDSNRQRTGSKPVASTNWATRAWESLAHPALISSAPEGDRTLGLPLDRRLLYH